MVNPKNTRYSDEALMAVFGTTRPSERAVIRWKGSWKDDDTRRIQIYKYNAAIKFLTEHDVDPLYYQFVSVPATLPYLDSDGNITDKGGSVETHYVVFFSPEHEVFFKLHQGLA